MHYTTAHVAILLVVIVAASAVLARRLRVAPSIVLVVLGIALALVPGLPPVELDPEIVLTIILPPLIYWAGVSMSWPEFKKNIRPIALLAVGCVVFTTVGVAAVTHYLLGLPWAVAFVLGAIVSPPDVVAPMSIARPLGLPRRLMTVLEGEGLANDATALILYRFAVIAVSTGLFSLVEAATTFSVVVAGETVYGILVGWAMLRLRRWIAEPRIELTVALLTPYLAFWVPHFLGGSGVLAAVAAGLYTSWYGPKLISAATRLQGTFFWDLYNYLLEGLVFLLTGLQARHIIEKIDGNLPGLLFAALVTTAVVLVVRFLWVYPATYLPRWIAPRLASRYPVPPREQVFVIAFTGVRGVVTLAAALAIPLTIESGEPFPHRDLILFLAFSVVVVTLIGEGLLLPTIVRALGLPKERVAEREREDRHEFAARQQAAEIALRRLDELGHDVPVPEAVAAPLVAQYREREGRWRNLLNHEATTAELRDRLEYKLIDAQREHVYELLRHRKITDESRRRIERELDLEEQRINCPRCSSD
jgi:CPA1 family monovalent cation:H+ antiporter